MQSETVTLYYAEDGTPFKDNKLACEAYEKCCVKIRQLIMSSKIKFWSSSGKRLINELLDIYSFDKETKKCYLDKVKDVLKNGCEFFSIYLNREEYENLCEFDAAFESVWEITQKYLRIDDCDLRMIKHYYNNGDVCQYDSHNCCWINLDHNIRCATQLRNCLE